jgi:plasmid stabilization system protein ParE
MAEVCWSLTASADLQEIEDFIARDSPLHAVNFVDRIVEAAETLQQAPQLGRVVPEFGRTDLRELLFRGYRIVYLVKGGVVSILSPHCSRGFVTKPGRRLRDGRVEPRRPEAYLNSTSKV